MWTCGLKRSAPAYLPTLAISANGNRWSSDGGDENKDDDDSSFNHPFIHFSLIHPSIFHLFISSVAINRH